jgi:drug/metabolite transporter (DMT)-like permease
MKGGPLSRLASAWVSLPILFWGVSFVATRVALRAFHPFGLVATRFLCGALLVYGFLWARKQTLWPARRDWPVCFVLGLILGAHLLIQGFALLSTSAIHSGWIVGFSPVVIALGAQIFLGERLRALGWAGAALATLGVWLVAFATAPDWKHPGAGDLLVLSSTVTWAAYSLLSTGPVSRNGAVRVTAFALGVGALVCTLAALGTGFVIRPPTAHEIGALLFLGVLCSGVAFALWFRAIEIHGAAKIGALIYFQPFVTLVAGAALLDETVTPYALAGGPLVVLGVWFVNRWSSRGRIGPRLPPSATSVALNQGEPAAGPQTCSGARSRA